MTSAETPHRAQGGAARGRGWLKRLGRWLDARRLCGYCQDSHPWSAKQELFLRLKQQKKTP